MKTKLFPHHQQNQTSADSDLLQGSLLDKILLFAIPVAASSILQQMFNSADTAVVGRFAGAEDMAAVGANSSVINLIVSLFLGLSTGANVTIGRLIGMREKKRINTAIGTIMVVAGISGILLLILGLSLASPILTLMNTPKDVLPLAILYLRIYAVGLPFIMLYDFGSAILRSKGDSRRPLYALLAAGVLNVALNLFLVIVFHLGVAGVAIATALSNMVSSGLILSFLIHGETDFRLERKFLKVDGKILREVLRIGVPSGLQGTIFSLSNNVIQIAINGFGSVVVAGSAAAVNFEFICYYAINAFNQAATTFISQNYAAGKKARCRKIYWFCLTGGFLSCAVLNWIVILFHRPLLGLFSTNPKVLHYALIRLTHVLAFQSLAASYEVTGSVLRGMGYSMTPTTLTIFGCVLFRIFWVFVIFPVTGTLSLLFYVYLASWILTGVLVCGAFAVIARKKLRD